jgi:hypothetical protein
MACYIGQQGGTVWLAVSDSYSATSPYCGLAFSAGSFRAQMVDGVPNWVAAFVVVY